MDDWLGCIFPPTTMALIGQSYCAPWSDIHVTQYNPPRTKPFFLQPRSLEQHVLLKRWCAIWRLMSCQKVVLIAELHFIAAIRSPWGRGRMGRGGRKLALCLAATLLAAWVLYRLLISCASWNDHRPIMMPRNVSDLISCLRLSLILSTSSCSWTM